MTTAKRTSELKRIRTAITRNRKRIDPGTTLSTVEKRAVVMRLEGLLAELNKVELTLTID